MGFLHICIYPPDKGQEARTLLSGFHSNEFYYKGGNVHIDLRVQTEVKGLLGLQVFFAFLSCSNMQNISF